MLRFNGIEEYKQFGVLVLVMDGALLFQERAPGIPQEGEICFPGGGQEPDDHTLQETALRETYEEIALPPNRIDTITPLDPVIAPFGAVIHPYLGKTDATLGQCEPNPREVSKLFTIPLSHFLNTPPETYKIMVQAFPSEFRDNQEHILLPAKELNLPRRYHDGFGKHYNKIYCYHYQQELIWGLTAKIIKNLVDHREHYRLDRYL